MRRVSLFVVSVALLAAACGSERPSDGSAAPDAGAAEPPDAASSALPDSGTPDAGTAPAPDAGTPVEAPDAGTVVEPPDAGAVPETPDAGVVEAADAGLVETPDAGTPALTPPPAMPSYSGNACPVLHGAPTADPALNTGFPSFGDQREFRLIVPPSYDGTTPYPLVFGWHWLGSSSKSFASTAEVATAAEEFHFIAVLPEHLKKANGDKAYVFEWPFAETWGAEKDLGFVDDLLACISQQFEIDPARVYGMGVSAGALWASYVSGTDRAKHFASFVVISGGLGEQDVPFTGFPVFKMDYVPQPNKFPGLVVWGGALDFLILDFNRASIRLRDAWEADDHFVATCEHHQGHATPPFTPPTGHTKFYALWQWMAAHPYGLPAGTSPWANGLPPYFPDDSTMTCTIP